jgi:hypothetical protein
MVMVAAAAHNTARQRSTQPREHFRFPVSSRIEWQNTYPKAFLVRPLGLQLCWQRMIRKGWDKRRFAEIASKINGLVRTLTPLI